VDSRFQTVASYFENGHGVVEEGAAEWLCRPLIQALIGFEAAHQL
jgi:hypothetical protein